MCVMISEKITPKTKYKTLNKNTLNQNNPINKFNTLLTIISSLITSFAHLKGKYFL